MTRAGDGPRKGGCSRELVFVGRAKPNIRFLVPTTPRLGRVGLNSEKNSGVGIKITVANQENRWGRFSFISSRQPEADEGEENDGGDKGRAEAPDAPLAEFGHLYISEIEREKESENAGESD